jgi:hypothetical protein
MKMRTLSLSTCLLFVMALTANAAVRALVVGIDEYPGGDRLSSCVNDARGMTDLLTKQFGVPKENVRVLLNADASAIGIRRAFKEHLLDTTKPGDDAIFYFSGHGAVVPNWADESAGRLIKVLVAHHTKLTNLDLLTQNELKSLLGQLQTTSITVILDCCHAGSMTRSSAVPATEDKIKAMNIGFGAAEKYLGEEPREDTRIYSRSADNLIPALWLGACLSNQVSYCSRPMSRFTGALIEQLQDKHRQPLAEIFPSIQAKVEQQTRATARGVQTPIMEGPSDRPLVRGVTVVSASPVRPPQTPPSVLVVRPESSPAVAPPSRQDFPLMVQIDKGHYTKGDTMKVRVIAGADCYLRLYLMNAATEIQQLFPNQYATNNLIRKNEIIEIPAPDTFVMRMGEPFGIETLLAVGSHEQFSDLFRPRYSVGGFQEMDNMPPSRATTRGITVEAASRPTNKPGNKVSYSSVQYTVAPR